MEIPNWFQADKDRIVYLNYLSRRHVRNQEWLEGFLGGGE